MEKDEFKIVAKVTSNEVDSAVNTVKDLKEQDKEKRFYGDKAYDTNEVFGVVVPPRISDLGILLGIKL